MPLGSIFGKKRKGEPRLKNGKKPSDPQDESLLYSKITSQISGGKGMCHGCSVEIEKLFIQYDESKRQGTPSTMARVFHQSFSELDACARKCNTCSLFRQALWQRQPSIVEEKALQSSRDPMYAELLPAKHTTMSDRELRISVSLSEEYSQSAYVSCTKSRDLINLDLEYDPQKTTDIASNWLRACVDEHTCHNLGASNRNPTRLIRILDDSTAQLVQPAESDTLYDFVTISYSWGTQEPLTKEQREHIDAGRTLKDNVEARLCSFSLSQIPVMLRQAILFIRALGYEYIWIDSVCIIQLNFEDWTREAPYMREYYGNSVFTLYLCSVRSPAEELFKAREAWRLGSSGGRIRGNRLVSVEEPIEEIRSHSPLAQRGWTLQEEQLSPRRLFWFSQRLYWVCSTAHHAEGLSTPDRRPQWLPERDKASILPFNFLAARWNQDVDTLHDEWLTIVQSYCQRCLTKPGDKFEAISGLAASYWPSHADEQYLAGLWKSTLVQDMSWKVAVPGSWDPRFAQIAPSWSWAALPYATDITFHRTASQTAEDFSLDEVVPKVERYALPEDNVKEGKKVISLVVRGRIRRLWSKDSKLVSWSLIAPSRTDASHFNFKSVRGQQIHSINRDTGQLVVTEGTRPTVCELDYVDYCSRINDGTLDVVYCLEIGPSVMLLLDQVAASDVNERCFRRVGLCTDFAGPFFTMSEPECVRLL